MTTAEDYLYLPYHIVLIRDEDDDGDVAYVAQVEELPGCISQGETPDEAANSVRDAMKGWIAVALEDGKAIPEPTTEPEYNGKILVRVPRTLHGALIKAAQLEGVSLNQFIVGVLAAAVDWRITSSPSTESKIVAVPYEAAHREPRGRGTGRLS